MLKGKKNRCLIICTSGEETLCLHYFKSKKVFQNNASFKSVTNLKIEKQTWNVYSFVRQQFTRV